MEAKKRQLIKLVMELGRFFANCDGNFDVREANFIEGYINRISESENISKDELREIENSITKKLDIKFLIEETKNMRDIIPQEEMIPLFKALSYFIYNVIMADGNLLSVEQKYYSEWKEAIGIDDDVDISAYM